LEVIVSKKVTIKEKLSFGRSFGVNFINIHTAFMREDPESAKNTVKLSVFFELLGSTSIKAARKTLMKLTPFIQELTVKSFLMVDALQVPSMGYPK
jgi:hypothetical protein